MVDIWNLQPGAVIRIVKTFRDCYGAEFEAGTVLHFKDRSYVPYHSGHTVYFAEATMFLCDNDETCVIVQNQGGEFFALL